MNRKVLAIALIVVIFIISFAAFFIFTSDEESSLVIYTYDSLLADPGFEFDRAFEKFAGLRNGSVKVVYLSDSGEILTKAITEKQDPIADILIGLDNSNVGIARSESILTPYIPIGAESLYPELIQGLAEDHLLTPYDYGVISLYYFEQVLSDLIDPDTFTLDQLKNTELASTTIFEDPNTSSPGLGFLLHTIAVFGDEDRGVSGVLDGDWKDYWSQINSNGGLIVSSWGEAFNVLYTEEAARNAMISYTTSPAYDSCVFDDYSSTSSSLTNEGGTTWGWQQIEGIGLVKNSPNSDLAKQFIDWFISDNLQNEIYLNQWVYPAKQHIAIPSCYSNVIPFDSITSLNTHIPQNILEQNLETWLLEWEQVFING